MIRDDSSMLRATAWMIASIVASTIELVLVHWLGPNWPAPLQLFWRQGAALIVLSPFILRAGWRAFATRSPWIILFRSVCAMLGLGLWIYAVTRLPIATATTLSFTRPLWVVLLAWLLLKERLSWLKVVALCLGFLGVLVMMQPGANATQPLAQLAAVTSSLLFAASFVSVKAMTADNDPLVILVYSCVLGVLFAGVPAAWMWRTPSISDGAVLFGLGLASLTAFGCSLHAIRLQNVASLMPLDYLRLPLVTVVGILLFSERPGLAALAGGALIVLSALATAVEGLWRSRARLILSEDLAGSPVTSVSGNT